MQRRTSEVPGPHGAYYYTKVTIIATIFINMIIISIMILIMITIVIPKSGVVVITVSFKLLLLVFLLLLLFLLALLVRVSGLPSSAVWGFGVLGSSFFPGRVAADRMQKGLVRGFKVFWFAAFS